MGQWKIIENVVTCHLLVQGWWKAILNIINTSNQNRTLDIGGKGQPRKQIKTTSLDKILTPSNLFKNLLSPRCKRLRAWLPSWRATGASLKVHVCRRKQKQEPSMTVASYKLSKDRNLSDNLYFVGFFLIKLRLKQKLNILIQRKLRIFYVNFS